MTSTSAKVLSQPPALVAYHPLFSSPDADTVLQSTNGILYRVHSVTLRTTCGFFRDMFSLPQDGMVKQYEDVIAMGETGAVLELFLRIICCMEIQPWPSLEDVWTILHVAEKYDAPGVISTVRLTLSSNLAVGNPLTVFAIAARFGWESEAKAASKLTLSLSLRKQPHQDVLRRAPSDYLLRLFNLHQERKALFHRRLLGCAEGDPFYSWNLATATPSCGHTFGAPNVIFWHKLRSRILLEFEERPLEYAELVEEIREWEETKNCSQPICCSKNVFSPEVTLSAVKACLDGLPSTI